MVLLIALSGYIDPSLSRRARAAAPAARHGNARAGGRGYARPRRDREGLHHPELLQHLLDPSSCAACWGLVIETVYHFVVVEPGEYQDRAGMLFGPFSPIYGFGAVLMTMALNRFHDKPVILIFLISAVIGGAFEYLTSWFMEFAFGAVAWGLHGHVPFHRWPHEPACSWAMWGLLGRRVDQAAAAVDAEAGEPDSLEAALYHHVHLCRADDRRRRS